jgi:hypothetical protein
MKHTDKQPDLSDTGPYATLEDKTVARSLGMTVKQLRTERAEDDGSNKL